jgi:hypothetical protein
MDADSSREKRGGERRRREEEEEEGKGKGKEKEKEKEKGKEKKKEMERAGERREPKMSGFYREEPLGPGQNSSWAGKFRVKDRVLYQVGTKGW